MGESDDKSNRELATGFEVFAADAERNRVAERPGKPFGRYLLLRPLGRGGMGVVVEAEDTTLRRRVAIKILPKSLSNDGDRLKRLLNEARAIAQLNHPNTLSVYDIAEHNGYHFIAMEFVRGCSAEQLLAERGALPWPEATRVIADACRGLAAAHSAGIVHRDIKPGNILRHNDGTAKLADFGLAKFLDQNSLSLTEAGYVVGTPLYMSPEQCDGAEVGEAGDLYSLGATYYALLTGRPPYLADKALQVMYAHQTKPVPDPREANPSIPSECAKIVRRAMAKKPAHRYPSAAAMLTDLLKVLATAESSQLPNAAAADATPPGTQLDAMQGRLALANRPTLTAPIESLRRRLRIRSRMAVVAAVVGIAAIVAIMLLAFLSTRSGQSANNWQPLFDGKTLTGWRPSGNTGKQWRVENGEIVGRGDNTFLYSDASDFENFRCRVTMTLNADANSGLFFRCNDSEGGYPNAYEAQLGWPNGQADFGKLYCNFQQGHETKLVSASRRPGISPGEPFTLEVIANGPRIQLLLHGELVNDFTDSSKARTRRGCFGIQSYGEKTEVRIRHIEVERLKSGAE